MSRRLAFRAGQSHRLRDRAKAFPSSASPLLSVSVEEGYLRWAATYDRAPNPLLALLERNLGRILPALAGSCALDLGCGTGRWLARLLARGAGTVVGIDLSAAMLKVAQGTPGIRDRLLLAQGSQLPFQDSVFDFVLCSFALNHMKDLRAIARELGRAMKGKGRALICEMHPAAYARGWRTGFRDARSAVEIEAVGHPAEDVIAVFGSNGLACVTLSDLYFGESEHPIFVEAGKEEIFESACQVPAIQVYEFMKTDTKTRRVGNT